jgi:ribosomal protein S18 acetylase RimI-like enzyme
MHEMAWTAEHACLNAWPATRNLLVGGWLVRASGGPIRRANSANPMRGADHNLVKALPEIRSVFDRLGQPCIFRVPTLVDAGVHAALDAAGFLPAESETVTLLADLNDAAAVPGVTADSRPSAAWLAARQAFGGADETATRIYRDMLDAIVGPTCFAMTRSDGEVASIAYGAVSCGLLVIESVATRPDLRRQGHGRRTVSSLMTWAAGQGVRHACLQVVADNHPAVRLYQELGFETELYRYAYRRLPS